MKRRRQDKITFEQMFSEVDDPTAKFRDKTEQPHAWLVLAGEVA